MRPDRTFTPPQQKQAIYRLGVMALLTTLQRGVATRQEAATLLTEIQSIAKRNYRKWALALHPDKTGNDDEKQLEWQCLAATYAQIQAIQVGQNPPPQPSPIQTRTVIIRTGYVTTHSSSTTCSTTTNFY